MIIKAVNDGLKDGDVSRVRQSLAMTAYMANAKAHEDFKDSVSYAEKEISDLYESDNGEAFTDDTSSENYIAIAKLLTKNFSKKKTEAILKIGESVFEKKVKSSEKLYYGNQDFFGKKSPKINLKVCVVVLALIVVTIVAIVKIFHR